MLDPKSQAAFDQSAAAIIEHMPPLWWNLYKRLQAQGFTNVEALDLVKTFIAKT